MTILDLNHYSIAMAPEALAETVRFYEDVVGLKDGPRPPFAFPGNWLYAGDSAVVHLLGNAPVGKPADTGRLDHIAFRATGLKSMRAKLNRLGIHHWEREVPGARLQQVFVRDPHGILIELNYPVDETA
jgi:catechol 2,3-dioxygenase-like lactoylglutathione lyase family enzyme